MSLDSFYKKLNKFNDEITSLENVSSRKEEKKPKKPSIAQCQKTLQCIALHLQRQIQQEDK